MANIHTYQVEPFQPYIDPKQNVDYYGKQRPMIVDGKNFMPSTNGYRSYFGSSPISNRRLPTEQLTNSQLFSLREDCLVLCNQFGILRFDPSTEGWYYLVRTEGSQTLSSAYPWSLAYVGGDWFFCKIGFGVWRYRLDENSGKFITANVPDRPVSVCASGGRLVILGYSTYAWSAVGDGEDLATSLETGAGFQALSLIGGTPLAVRPNTIGFIVYTTSGLIRVEAIDTPNPFQHKVLAVDDYAPVSPWAITDIGTSSQVFLTKSGLYASGGDYPVILEKEFSKWLTGTKLKYVLQSSDRIPVALAYDAVHRWLILSYGVHSLEASPYSIAYVLDIELGKWGIFAQNHYCFSSSYCTAERFLGYKTMFASTDGSVRVIDKDYGTTKLPSLGLRQNYPVTVAPSYYEHNTILDENIAVFTAGCQIETYEWYLLGADSGTLGYWELMPTGSSLSITFGIPTDFINSYYAYHQVISNLDIDMADVPEASEINMANLEDPLAVDMANVDASDDGFYYAVFTSRASLDCQLIYYEDVCDWGSLDNINALIDIGLYHEAEFNDYQQSLVMTGFSLFHDQAGTPGDYIDMMLEQEAIIDMETLPDSIVDMGYGISDNPDYQATLISSSDGYGHLNLHIQTIEPLSIVGDRFNYNSYSTGLYHGFKLETTQAGGYFHLKLIQTNIFQGGLIYV